MNNQSLSIIVESTVIIGDVRAENDFVVHGRIEGTVRLPKNTVTIGPTGRVKGDIYARRIRVEGHSEGKLYGQEGIVIAKGADVKGSLLSPRIALAEGGGFKGDVDTNVKLEASE